MKKLLLALSAVLLVSGMARSQSVPLHRSCSSNDHLLEQLAANPQMAVERQRIEQFTQQFAASQPLQNGKTAQVIYNIPVVVHVLYNSSTTNISDAQILSQITVLNQDFQMMNADNTSVPAGFASLKADAQINFCLAQRDPNGAASTGIVRVSTTKSSFSTSSDDAKHTSTGGHDAWPRDQYLNLWVVPGIDGGGILGYAQFPGGTAATDGVVIAYNFFGNTGAVSAPYDKGRTATHEVGHWLNLRHIWGDDGSSCSGSDLVGDTPNQGSENYGCPSYPHVSCSNGTNGDMFMNYMDYTDDACMFMFSAGQKTRMHAVLASGGSRASLNSSLGCSAPNTAVCSAPGSQTATSITSSGAVVSWAAVSGAVSYTLMYKTSASATWTTVSALSSNSYTLSGLAAGTLYNYRVSTNCSGGAASAYTATGSFTTGTAAAGCGKPVATAATNLTSTSVQLNWAAITNATSYKVQYRNSSSSPWTLITGVPTNYRILTGLIPDKAYTYRIAAVCGSGTSAYSLTYSFATPASTTCSNNYESNNTTGTATVFAANTSISSMIGTTTDNDYYKIVTTTSQPKLKILLGNLPFDYDLKLYNSAGTLLGTSENGSTTGESLTYNAATAGATYYAVVYGYNGAYSTTSCYSLTNQTSATNLREENSQALNPEKAAIAFYPNPTRGDVSFNYFSRESQDAHIQVMDQSGRLVHTATVALTEGPNTGKFSIGQLPAGLYFIRYQAGDDVKAAKLLLAK